MESNKQKSIFVENCVLIFCPKSISVGCVLSGLGQCLDENTLYDEKDPDKRCSFEINVKTKYFEASTTVYVYSFVDDLQKDVDAAKQFIPAVFGFFGSTDPNALDDVKSVLKNHTISSLDSFEGARACICLSENNEDGGGDGPHRLSYQTQGETKANAQEWCFQNQIEFIEMCDGDVADPTSISRSLIDPENFEMNGANRLLEILNTIVWPSLTRTKDFNTPKDDDDDDDDDRDDRENPSTSSSSATSWLMDAMRTRSGPLAFLNALDDGEDQDNGQGVMKEEKASEVDELGAPDWLGSALAGISNLREVLKGSSDNDRRTVAGEVALMLAEKLMLDDDDDDDDDR